MRSLIALLLLAAPAWATLTPPNISVICGDTTCSVTWSNPMECAAPGAGCSVVPESRAWNVERCSGVSCVNFAIVPTPAGDAEPGATTAVGATSYLNTGLTNGVVYRYRVAASPYSNIVAGTPAAAATTTTTSTTTSTTTTATTSTSTTTTSSTSSSSTTSIVGATTTTTTLAGGAVGCQLMTQGTIANDAAYGNAVATDAAGNSFMAGQFSGTVNFGGTSLSSIGNGTDGFLAKYSSTCTLLWVKQFGGTAADIANGVAVDAGGNILVTGQFSSPTATFEATTLTNAGGSDVFLAKYATTGALVWAKRAGATGSDMGSKVAADTSSNVIVIGTFQGTVDFGVGPLVAQGSSDVFMVKYNSSGTTVWQKRLGGAGYEGAQDLALDGSGNIYFAGYFEQGVDFGGGALTSAGQFDDVFAKYDANGVYVFANRYGSTGDDRPWGIGANSAGTFAVTGTYVGTVSFGGTAFVDSGSGDGYVAVYNSAGVHQWSKRFTANTGPKQGRDAAVDSSGNVFLTGWTVASLNLGCGSMFGGSIDPIAAKFNSSGTCVWSRRNNTSINNSKHGLSIALDADGNAIVSGDVDSNLDDDWIAGGSNTASPAGVSAFLTKFGP